MEAIFLDFYGTVVHEDDDIIPVICSEIKNAAKVECTIKEIGDYWWKLFSKMFKESYGEKFISQRILNTLSLEETIRHYQADLNVNDIIEHQFDHWKKPKIFKDSKLFLKSLQIPIYILSNIDTDDIQQAIEYHEIEVDGVITSEDVGSYKPRPEMFLEALQRYRLIPDDVIHIGDSITSDVNGAQKVGIRAVWLNRRKRTKPENITPEYECSNLLEVINSL